MARRTRTGRGSPLVRRGLVLTWTHIVEHFPTPGGREVLAAIKAGEPVELTDADILRALYRIDPRLAEPYSFRHRQPDRRWLLDEHDRLTDITDQSSSGGK